MPSQPIYSPSIVRTYSDGPVQVRPRQAAPNRPPLSPTFGDPPPRTNLATQCLHRTLLLRSSTRTATSPSTGSLSPGIHSAPSELVHKPIDEEEVVARPNLLKLEEITPFSIHAERRVSECLTIASHWSTTNSGFVQFIDLSIDRYLNFCAMYVQYK
ncbi:unnamed protein product [Haemonchus placei]|uniref:Uncharacterized protein n=1 Tax=Haemonchus placei TaxID=6290 RepID=A0A0N4WNI6_HAEPC|nr:unnamed protein product [Haemonchus placei]